MGDMNSVYTFEQGNTPVLLSVPHAGIGMPPGISDRLTEAARQLPDTDWFVDRLYRWVRELGVGTLVANYSRYVIDLNRPPDDATISGGSGTGLIPLSSFSGESLYRADEVVDSEETAQRRQRFWQPYHDTLQAELQALKQKYGFAILLDAHSIRSEVPALFDGTLPDLNLGSNGGSSADSGLVSLCMSALSINPEYSLVLDGRFRGGYITRHYGQPASGIHALQLEMAQSVYMCKQQVGFDQTRSANIQPVLQGMIETLLNWSPARV